MADTQQQQAAPESRTPSRWLRFAVVSAVLCLGFIKPLINLATFALKSELHSYILLIPFISAYLIYQKRAETLTGRAAGHRIGWPFILCGLAALALHTSLLAQAKTLAAPDHLVLPILAFVSFQIGAFALCLGQSAMSAVLFPLLFLFLLTPLPNAAIHAIAVGLQQYSADAAHAMLNLTGTSVYREGLAFHMPGLSVVVGEECSGIRSTLVLFITSLVAGYLLLKRPFSRILLAAAVFPLGILRNGFRIVTISLLTIHVDPNVINSPLHHKGGPIFFALSLPLLLGLLWILVLIERRKRAGLTKATKAGTTHEEEHSK